MVAVVKAVVSDVAGTALLVVEARVETVAKPARAVIGLPTLAEVTGWALIELKMTCHVAS